MNPIVEDALQKQSFMIRAQFGYENLQTTQRLFTRFLTLIHTANLDHAYRSLLDQTGNFNGTPHVLTQY